jgi:hypothetical protein
MKNHRNEDDLETAVSGGAVSRRWLLKRTAAISGGTIALAAFGVGLGSAAALASGPPTGDPYPAPGKVETALAAFDFDGGV